MFSMFGRTGAPTKGAVIFCMPEKWATPSEKESDEQKRSPVFEKLQLTHGDD